MRAGAVAALLLLPALGCDDHLLAHSRRGTVDCDREPPLNWENFGRASMEVNCAGCHSSLYTGARRSGAPEGVDLNTLDGVIEWVDRSLVRAVDEQNMPPGAGLPEEERAMLEEWLVCEVELLALQR